MFLASKMHFVDRWLLSMITVFVMSLIIASMLQFSIANWLTALFYSLGVNQLRLTLFRR